jgi:TonB family protein
MSTWTDQFEPWLLTYLLNALWQVPLVFLAAWAAARLARPAGPRLEHRVWVAALLLEPVLPLCNVQLNQLGRQAWALALWFQHGGAGNSYARVIFGQGTASAIALPRYTMAALLAIASAYSCAVLYCAGRLAWSLWTTEDLRRRAIPLKLAGEAARNSTRLQQAFALEPSQVRFADSAAIAGPATVGMRRHTLLLPVKFLSRLSSDELDAVMAHEFAHMRRWDFAKNLFYGIIALPVAFHPLLWLTRARLAETRELVCDAMAAEAVGGADSYARSLLGLAQLLAESRAPRILHAIGILDANIFERRVMFLTRMRLEVKGARQLTLVAACGLVAIFTCTTALALRMDVNTPPAHGNAPARIRVRDGLMIPETKKQPVYPEQAKKDRVEGKVVLAAVIGKDGTVENLRVVSGPSPLQPSALDAVRQWRYKPYLLNGEPVEVDTTIRVVYTLEK